MAQALDLDTAADAGPPASRRRRRWPALAAAGLVGVASGWAAAAVTATPEQLPLTGDRLVLVVSGGALGAQLSTYERDGVLVATLVNTGTGDVRVQRVAVGDDAQNVAATVRAGGTLDVRVPVTITCDPQRPRAGAEPPRVRVTGSSAGGAEREVIPRLVDAHTWGDLRAECRRQAIGDAQVGDGTVT